MCMQDFPSLGGILEEKKGKSYALKIVEVAIQNDRFSTESGT